MQCGSKDLQFTSKRYNSETQSTFKKVLQDIKKNSVQLSNFNTQLHSNHQGQISSSKAAQDTFQISYNKILKEVKIQAKSKQTQFWYCIQDEIDITKGDTLRVGQALLYVHDVYPIKQQNSKKSDKSTPKMTQTSDEVCRICFTNQESIENPLLNLCSCSGSVKYMHLQCYRDWYHQKIKFFNQRKITYFQIKDIRCELCKARMPFSTWHKGKQYTILDYKKSFNNPIPNMEMMMFPDDNSLFDDSIPQSLQMVSDGIQIEQDDRSSFSQIYLDQNQNVVDRGRARPGNILGSQEHQVIPTQAGMYVLLRSQKINEDDEEIIELILIKLGSDYMVTFGNEEGVANIIIKNGKTSRMHMSLNFVNDRVFLSNFSDELGTFIKMRNNISYEFIGKKGTIIDNQQAILAFKQRPWFFKCFQPQQKFRIGLIYKNL